MLPRVPHHQAPQPGLSVRECEVLHLIKRGYTEQEIAARSGFSIQAVERLKLSGMRRLHLSTQYDVVRYGRQHDWR